VLLPGDLEAAGEAALLRSGARLEADVLLLPHHGSASSSTWDFLEAVDPAVVIASAPCAGRFAMPAPAVMERAREIAAPLWWTGRDGAVGVSLGTPLWVRGYADRAAFTQCVPSAGFTQRQTPPSSMRVWPVTKDEAELAR